MVVRAPTAVSEAGAVAFLPNTSSVDATRPRYQSTFIRYCGVYVFMRCRRQYTLLLIAIINLWLESESDASVSVSVYAE